jgi:uncharacterized membrane protein
MTVSKLLITFIIFIVLDIIFLTATGKIFFDQIVDVQRVIVTMNYSAVVVEYAALLFALYWFILSRRSDTIILDAVILGGIINGSFELTNAALFKKWRIETILLDTFWGAFLWGFVAFLYVNYIRPY